MNDGFFDLIDESPIICACCGIDGNAVELIPSELDDTFFLCKPCINAFFRKTLRNSENQCVCDCNTDENNKKTPSQINVIKLSFLTERPTELTTFRKRQCH